jgi:hypothetical protein
MSWESGNPHPDPTVEQGWRCLGKEVTLTPTLSLGGKGEGDVFFGYLSS